MNNSILTNDIRYTLHLHFSDRFISAKELQERKQKSQSSAVSLSGCFCRRDILSTLVAQCNGCHRSAGITLTVMQKENILCLFDDGKFFS